MNESGTTRYRYDPFGNLVEQVFVDHLGQSYVQTFAYDQGDNLTETLHPSGRLVRYQRDELRRVIAVESESMALPRQPKARS